MPLLKLEPLEARDVPSAVVFVGGWGSSMYQYAHSEPVAAAPLEHLALNYTKIEFAEPLPVLMVLADRQYDAPPRAPGTAADDVVVDGRIITGENFDSAPTAESGYIRVKKLNSGG